MSSILTRLVGSDGTINFWDKDARTRLKSALFVFIYATQCNLTLCKPLTPLQDLYLRPATTEQARYSPMQFHTTGQRDIRA